MSDWEDEVRKAIARATCDDSVFASDLDWDLKNPCDDCPFRKSAAFHEGVAGSLPSYLDEIEDGTFAHTCHKTDTRKACDGPRDWNGTPKHCAGAILMLIKSGDGKDLQLPLLRAADAGKLDVHDMTRRAEQADDIYTVRELVAFYMRGIRNMVRRPEKA